MAPFKLKFRTSSSRNTSQEVDNNDQQTNQSLLNYSNLSEIGASSSTIDSQADCTSIESYGNNDRKLLLANNNGSNVGVGYSNPTLTRSEDCVKSNNSKLSYDHSSEDENLAENMEGENLTLTTFDSENCLNEECSVRENQQNDDDSTDNSQIDNLSITCTDPDCKIYNAENENYIHHDDNDTINSTEYLISTSHGGTTSTVAVASTSTNDSKNNDGNENDNNDDDDDDNILECTDDYCERNSSMDKSQSSEQCNDNELSDNQQWNQTSTNNSNQNDNISYCSQNDEITIPEIINNKSSKKLYKAFAKQSGFTCKMSDQCRCMECQSHYFDCEFDDNDHQKTDGGLGAGTPMFISEVMHGSACIIL